MLITGSYGIRLVCPSYLLARRRLCVVGRCGLVSCGCRPALVSSGGSPLSPACLMFAAVCLDTRLRRLVNRATCVSTRSSTPLHLVIDVGAAAVPSHGFSPLRPASSTRRAGRYGCRCGGSRLCLLDYRLAISSVRFSIGWRRMWSLPRPMTIICADCYPLARPIRFTHRLIISSSPLPDHSTRGTGRGLLVSVAYSARSLLRFDLPCGLFVRVLLRMASGVVLLAWLSYYVSCRCGTG